MVVFAAKAYNIQVEKADTLFQVLFMVIQGHLKTSDVATADLVAQRLQPPKDEVAQAVLEVDVAAEVLEPDDRKLITADQEKVVSENQSFESLTEEYRQRRKKINLYLEQQARKQPASKRSKISAPTLPSHSHKLVQSFFCQTTSRVPSGKATANWIGMATAHLSGGSELLTAFTGRKGP